MSSGYLSLLCFPSSGEQTDQNSGRFRGICGGLHMVGDTLLQVQQGAFLHPDGVLTDGEINFADKAVDGDGVGGVVVPEYLAGGEGEADDVCTRSFEDPPG